MQRCSFALIICWILAGGYGCSSGKPSSPAEQPVRLDDLVGKWRLVGVGGQPPAAFGFKSLQIELAADGTWTSQIEMQGQFAGMSMKGGGKWSLADGAVNYTSGDNSGKSRVRLASGRLVLDPDFTIRKDGATEVPGEYER
jgi:hypothetical protein